MPKKGRKNVKIIFVFDINEYQSVTHVSTFIFEKKWNEIFLFFFSEIFLIEVYNTIHSLLSQFDSNVTSEPEI